MNMFRNFGRFVCQLVENTSWITYKHEVDSGWLLVPTSGGSVPFRDSSSLGDLGFLEVLGASDPSLPDDAMVSGHHLQPIRSAFVVHVGSDVLLKTASKIHVLRQGGGRLQAGSSGRRWRRQPGVYKNLNVISLSFKDVFVIWAVIIGSSQKKKRTRNRIFTREATGIPHVTLRPTDWLTNRDISSSYRLAAERVGINREGSRRGRAERS